MAIPYTLAWYGSIYIIISGITSVHDLQKLVGMSAELQLMSISNHVLSSTEKYVASKLCTDRGCFNQSVTTDPIELVYLVLWIHKARDFDYL